MPDARISALTAQTTGGIAAGDLFASVDVSDTTMAATGTDKQSTFLQLQAQLANVAGAGGPIQFFDFVNGNDINDGLSWTRAKQHAQAASTALGSKGQLWGSQGAQPLSQQLVIGESVDLYGNGRPASPGFDGFDAGTYFTWSAGNPTANAANASMISTGNRRDRQGVMQNFSLQVPALSNLRGIDVVNPQNMPIFQNIVVQGGLNAGFAIYANTTLTGGFIGAPGFIAFYNCWVTDCGTRPFLIGGGVEQISFYNCGIDDGAVATHALAAWTVGATGITGETTVTGRSLSLALYSCKNEMGSTTGDFPFVQVNVGYDCDLTMVGCYEQSNFTSASALTTPTISYLATPGGQDATHFTVPVHVHGMSSQSRSKLIGGVTTRNTFNAASGGSRAPWSYDPALIAYS